MRAFRRRAGHRAADLEHTPRPAPACLATLALAVAWLGACGDNEVTGVGSELVAGGVVRTVEIILGADGFLLADTTVSGFSTPAAAGSRLIARDAAAGLESRAAVKFASAPFSIDVPIDSTTTEADTMAVFVGGRVEIVFDSVSRAPGDSARLMLEAIQEAWDPATATFTNRVDSAFSKTAWSVPGGGAAVPADSAVWSAARDTVSFFVDSALANAWTDAGDPTRGALVRTVTDGARLGALRVVLWLRARPSIGPDTILEIGIGSSGQTTLIDAAPPSTDRLLVGGVPAHRSFLRFAPGLDTLPVECPEEGVECDLTVADAALTFAGLELTPVPVAAELPILRPLTLTARPVIPDPQFPLERAPLGPSSGTTAVSADSLVGGVADSVVVIDVTRFVDAFLAGEEGAADQLAVAAVPEGFRWGTVAVARSGGVAAPRLRLVLTVASPQEIR